MQIYGLAQVHGPQAISAPHTARAASSASQVESANIQDEVNISDMGRLVEQAKQAPDIRQDRVQSLRAQIASGTYENVRQARRGRRPPVGRDRLTLGVWYIHIVPAMRTGLHVAPTFAGKGEHLAALRT